MFYCNELPIEIIKSAVRKKESLINDYILNSKTTEQWLLLVITTSPESYDIDNEICLDIQSKFSKIILLEDCKNKIHFIK